MPSRIDSLIQTLGRNGINFFDAFGGIGGARASLDKAGIPVAKHWSSEIDPVAAAIAKKNYPDMVELGDIRQVDGVDGPVDLFCGGFPCQDLSRGNVSGRGLQGNRSGLGYEIPRLLDRLQPRNVLVENVVPKRQEDIAAISKMLGGLEPRLVDAADFGPMRRPRLWFTDIDIPMYAPSQARFRDALSPKVPDQYTLSQRAVDYMNRPAGASGRTHFQRHGFDVNDPKARTIPRVMYKGVPYNAVRLDDGSMRKLTPEEVERLFGFPEGYTAGVSDSRRYMGLGNSWSTDAAAHILSGLLP